MKINAIVNTDLNERTEKPSVNAPTYNYYKKGNKVTIIDIVNGDPYEGNKVWYKLDNGKYVWSGGVEGIKSLIDKSTEVQFDAKDYYWIKDYDIPKLWSEGLSGKGIKIAIVDSGLSLPHRDLIIDTRNCIDLSKSRKKGLHDKTGHGTHCTGIIKSSDNGIGLKGIACDSDIFFCKIRNDEVGDSLKRLKSGIEWAIDNKVDIISISMGRYRDNADLRSNLKRATSKNIIPVCAGGNQILNVTVNTDILYPAKYPECISVGAIDSKKKPSEGSLTGPDLTFYAPGTAIYSTFPDNGYKELTGTSQAVPYVCGIIALMLQYCNDNNISYTFQKMKDWLIQTSERADNSPYSIINPKNLLKHLKSIHNE